MIKPTIADTGIIVALLDKSDARHEWTISSVAKFTPPYFTCEAVITEACYLMSRLHGGKEDVLALIERGILQIDFRLQTETTAVKQLMIDYADVPMDFADACVVRMSELMSDSTVFTLDGDFWIYRKNGGEQIPLIIPDDVRR